MPQDKLSLQFKLQDGNRLVHLHVKAQILGIVVGVILDGKSAAIRVLIGFHGKGGKGYQVDAIAILQGIQIAIARGNPDNRRNTRQMTARRAHPHHVMIAPLDIH